MFGRIIGIPNLRWIGIWSTKSGMIGIPNLGISEYHLMRHNGEGTGDIA